MRSRPTTLVVVLSWTIVALAMVAAAVGLLWRTGSGSFTVTSARGQSVQLYGRGLYHFDTLFAAGGAQGTDAVVLLLAVPLLAWSTLRYRRVGVRGRLTHTGLLAFFLYVYASLALGTVAFNRMFPVYVTLFSASLFGTVLAARSTEVPHSPALPRRGLAAFLYGSGAVTLAVWGWPLAAAVASGTTTARLDTYTTEVTFALDLAVITPLTLLAGALVTRGRALGYPLAVPLLVLEATLAPLITAQTTGQVAAGVRFTPAEVAGPIAGFIVLAACAVWFLLAITRALKEDRS